MYERDYATTKQVSGTVNEADARVRDLLSKEGFGVLTEIDVQATLKKKLGVERRPYRILGACNPTFADKAIQAEVPIGVFLPCNVTVFQGEDGKTYVQAINPEAMFGMIENEALHSIGAEVGERLRRVMEQL